MYKNNNLPMFTNDLFNFKRKKNNLITISVAVTTQKLTEKTLYAMHISGLIKREHKILLLCKKLISWLNLEYQYLPIKFVTNYQIQNYLTKIHVQVISLIIRFGCINKEHFFYHNIDVNIYVNINCY